MTVDKMPERTSIALTRSMAYHPEVQHYVAEMRMDLETIDALPRAAPPTTGRPAWTTGWTGR